MTAPAEPARQQQPALSQALVARVAQAGRSLALPLGSVVIAFLIGAVVIAAVGTNPLTAYEAMACGGLGLFCPYGGTPALNISTTISLAAPLLLSGAAVAVAFRARLFNIGVQGQLIVGAIFTTVVAQKFASWPQWALLPAVLLAGIIGGALYAGIAGVLKALTGAHEVVTTIMLNYIAYFVLEYLLQQGGALENTTDVSFNLVPAAQLPSLIPSGVTLFGLPGAAYTADYGIVVAVLAVIVYALLMRRTALGYEISAVGESQRAARYAGVSVRRTIIVTMLISGAFSGLTGAILISGGTSHHLYYNLYLGTQGFDGIAVALLGQGVAIGIVLAGLLLGAIYASGTTLQLQAQVPLNIVQVLEALILFALAANFLRNFKIRFPTPGRELRGPDSIEAQQTAFEAEVSPSPGGGPSTSG